MDYFEEVTNEGDGASVKRIIARNCKENYWKTCERKLVAVWVMAAAGSKT